MSRYVVVTWRGVELRLDLAESARIARCSDWSKLAELRAAGLVRAVGFGLGLWGRGQFHALPALLAEADDVRADEGEP